MLDTVKINHVQHISFTQSRLTDAVSVILSELLSYEHPSKAVVFIITIFHREVNARQRTLKSLKHFSNFPLDKNSHMREQDFAVQILV